MARPVVHDEALRRRLLDTAVSLIARDGAAAVSLRAIAAAAGTSTTAVYSLFGGKAELLTAVLDDGFASFAASQQAAAGDVEALGRAYRAWALAHPALYGLMFGGSLNSQVPCQPTPGASEPSIAPLFAAVGEAMSGAGQDEVARMVGIVWGQVHGLVSLELAGAPAFGGSWPETFDAAVRDVRHRLTCQPAADPPASD